VVTISLSVKGNKVSLTNHPSAHFQYCLICGSNKNHLCPLCQPFPTLPTMVAGHHGCIEVTRVEEAVVVVVVVVVAEELVP
jgi:hypothetical protein